MKGYRGIGPEKGVFIKEEEAYQYAKAHLDDMPDEDRQMFVDFFFSGNYIKEDGDAET